MFTLGNWIFLAVWIAATIIVIIDMNDWDKGGWLEGLINFITSMIVALVIMLVIRWYNTSTASGIRAVKDYQSEINNGIEREVTITAEDGREIFYYEGKIDIESNHSDNYIKFESEDGKRYIIYYGIQDTIQIIEK